MWALKEVYNKVIKNVHMCSLTNIKIAKELRPWCNLYTVFFFVKGGIYCKSRYLRISLRCLTICAVLYKATVTLLQKKIIF